jgi:hypothetical protein
MISFNFLSLGFCVFSDPELSGDLIKHAYCSFSFRRDLFDRPGSGSTDPIESGFGSETPFFRVKAVSTQSLGFDYAQYVLFSYCTVLVFRNAYGNITF